MYSVIKSNRWFLFFIVKKIKASHFLSRMMHLLPPTTRYIVRQQQLSFCPQFICVSGLTKSLQGPPLYYYLLSPSLFPSSKPSHLMMGSRWPNMTGFRSLVFLQFYSLLFFEIRKNKNSKILLGVVLFYWLVFICLFFAFCFFKETYCCYFIYLKLRFKTKSIKIWDKRLKLL